MNNSKRIVLLTVSVGITLIVFSFLPEIKTSRFTLKNVDLFSDIRKEKQDSVHTDEDPIRNDNDPAAIDIVDKPTASRDLAATYMVPQRIINFEKDTNKPCMPRLASKFINLKKGKGGKIRIAFMGDSMIEGDLITQDLRKNLQQQFGGSGVGFVPVSDIAAPNRITASSKFSNDWDIKNFKTDKTTNIFISGHVFNSSGASWFSVRDNTTANASAINLLYSNSGSTTIVCDNNETSITGNDFFNVKKLKHGSDISVKITDRNLPLFGVSFEGDTGVIVDNFSFRGISGGEINKLNDDLLKDVNTKRPYDLIILEYGVNVLFRPKDTNFDWYMKLMKASIGKLKRNFPDTEILLLSAGDRAFRYGDKWQSAIGVPNLIEAQARLAYEENISFFNLFTSMGGTNSIVEWANSSPSLANKDYVHPNQLGAKKVAGFILNAIDKEIEKSQNKLK